MKDVTRINWYRMNISYYRTMIWVIIISNPRLYCNCPRDAVKKGKLFLGTIRPCGGLVVATVADEEDEDDEEEEEGGRVDATFDRTEGKLLQYIM